LNPTYLVDVLLNLQDDIEAFYLQMMVCSVQLVNVKAVFVRVVVAYGRGFRLELRLTFDHLGIDIGFIRRI